MRRTLLLQDCEAAIPGNFSAVLHKLQAKYLINVKASLGVWGIMKRKEFIESSCKACMLMAAGYFLPKLTGCSPGAYSVFKTEIVDKKISIPLTMFDTDAMQFVRPKGWYFDIAVQKNADNTYQALLLQCTHQENQLTLAGKRGYLCNFHGSLFDLNGIVKKGPAEKPLERYYTSIENNHLIIQVPKAP
ncbi:MAG: Rieske (2Fe-2S) protein [Panacibacter sp.]